jgi:hypothetical protein
MSMNSLPLRDDDHMHDINIPFSMINYFTLLFWPSGTCQHFALTDWEVFYAARL